MSGFLLAFVIWMMEPANLPTAPATRNSEVSSRHIAELPGRVNPWQFKKVNSLSTTRSLGSRTKPASSSERHLATELLTGARVSSAQLVENDVPVAMSCSSFDRLSDHHFRLESRHLATGVMVSLTMLAQIRPVETVSTYYTRRAREEREKAATAASAEARKAHLELALRLVGAAIEPALWAWPEGLVAHRQTTDGVTDMGNALAGAFPLPPSGTFESLLEAVGTIDF